MNSNESLTRWVLVYIYFIYFFTEAAGLNAVKTGKNFSTGLQRDYINKNGKEEEKKNVCASYCHVGGGGERKRLAKGFALKK